MINVLLLTIIILAGCATGYQNQGLLGGFSSIQLDENKFQVSFKGNGFTDKEKANDFALLRSAEIALDKGYKYFVIVDAHQYSKDSSYTTPLMANTHIDATTTGSAYSNGNNTSYSGTTTGTATTIFSGGQTYQISKPRTTNTIICFKDKPDDFSYNAEIVAKSIREKYTIQDAHY